MLVLEPRMRQRLLQLQQHLHRQPQPAAASVVVVNAPDIGSDEVNVTDIMVKVGDTAEVPQSIITVEA